MLFGDHNPSGRLTQTWYRSDSRLPPDLLDYDIIKSGQTYLYYRGKPLYPFGYGLSYTRSGTASCVPAPHSVAADGTITASVDVTNVGSRAGTEVVQLYTHQRTSRDNTPIRQLKAFQQVTLAPGQTRTVTLRLPAADLAHWDVTRSRWVVESSVHDLMVGASAEDIRARAAVRVRGETIPARDLSRPTRAENFDRYAGVRLVDETKPSGTAVGATAAGQWISFDGSALRAGPRTFTATVAKAGAGAGTIQIRWVAHRPAARHGHRAQHRRRLPVRQHQHRVGPGRRHPRRVPGVRLPAAAGGLLHQVTGVRGRVDRRPGPGPVGWSARRAGQRRCAGRAGGRAEEPERGAGAGAERAVVGDVAGGDRRALARDCRVPGLGDALATGEGPRHGPVADRRGSRGDPYLALEPAGPLAGHRVRRGAAAAPGVVGGGVVVVGGWAWWWAAGWWAVAWWAVASWVTGPPQPRWSPARRRVAASSPA